MKKTHHAAVACALACSAGSALAETSSVTLYGIIDEYVNSMHSSSGTNVLALEDGANLRTRWGLRGIEDLGGGYAAKFQLEGGINADNGTSATSGSLFDRQAWAGLATPYGEFRAGRQNGPIFNRGGSIDYTARTLGSMINNFGVPSRYDNDLAYISPRLSNVAVELHLSLPETTGSNRQVVYQLGVDYVSDLVAVGYVGLRARPPANAAVNADVVYDNVFADWKYGQGTVYLAFVRSNNNTSTAVSNNAGTILGNVGGLNAGTSADLRHFYNIWQASADYYVTPKLRVGALWGRIEDTSGRGRGASGGSAGAYYDLSKRTTLLALVDTIRNDAGGGWRPIGSAGLKSNFTNPDDVNGRTITGLQVGAIHRF